MKGIVDVTTFPLDMKQLLTGNAIRPGGSVCQIKCILDVKDNIWIIGSCISIYAIWFGSDTIKVHDKVPYIAAIGSDFLFIR